MLSAGMPVCGLAVDLSFDRYGIILERKPFGEEFIPIPPDPNLGKPPLPPEQSFTAKFKMVAVTRNDKGVIQVGLVDLKSNRGYMLGLGDSIEGVQVVDADYIQERARLSRDPEDYWVSMSGGSNHFEIVSKEVPVPVSSTNEATASPPTVGFGGKRVGTQKSSYLARRQSREEARIRKELARLRAEEVARAKTSTAEKTEESTSATVASVRAGKKGKTTGTQGQLSGTGEALLKALTPSDDSDLTQEEVDALLQEYQKELIRSGQTPLPIPLTPETDRALVEEGVLPAQN